VISTRAYLRLVGFIAAILVAGCSAPFSTTGALSPSGNAVQASPQSVALANYYSDLQQQMRLRGLLQLDDSVAKMTVTPNILTRNFEAIALFDEYRLVGSELVPQSTPSLLRRWEQPIRMDVEFGDSVPISIQNSDSHFLASYAQRLSQVSGHPITMTSRDPNYLVLIVGEDDRIAAVERLRDFVPGISENAIAALINLPRSRLCMVYAVPSTTNPLAYGKSIAIIRSEHPTLLRQSCIHEEVAQGLGLANDSPYARPSIFNDDEEFGFLTVHDEMLLNILYDRRLSVGMTADQARPIVQKIAHELAG
jgi:hypothetical protein